MSDSGAYHNHAYTFDIENAIATWRQFLERERSLSEEDLDELEGHLRDEIDAARRPGLSDEEIYRRALRRVGDYATIGNWYREVFWEKRIQDGQLGREIRLRLGMLGSYAKLAIRTFSREKFFSSVNILGLAFGIAVFLLVFLYIQFERSYDRFHTDAERIYRMVAVIPHTEGDGWSQYFLGDQGQDLVEEVRSSYTDVEEAVLTRDCPADRITIGDTHFTDLEMVCTDSHFFSLFSFELLGSTTEEPLLQPNTGVITQSLAGRLFGTADALGQVIPVNFYGEERFIEITGIVEDPPSNSLFSFDMLLSYASLADDNSLCFCERYVRLKAAALPGTVSDRIRAKLIITDSTIEDFKLEPLADVHFSTIRADRQGNITYVYLMSVIALIVLIIACSNYVNLAIARASRRIQEIGVRKVLGAHRRQIAHQFLSETVIVTLIAIPIGLLFVAALLPVINDLANTDVTIEWMANRSMLVALGSLLLFIGIVSGSYPSFFLSSLSPSVALRKGVSLGFAGKGLRRSLVIFQFFCSTILIAGTLIILSQLRFIQNTNLGFDAEQVVIVTVAGSRLDNPGEGAKQAFLNLPSVINVSATSGSPGLQSFRRNGFLHNPEGQHGSPSLETSIIVVTPTIDEDFLETMNVPLIAGRNVSAPTSDDENLEGVINRSGLRILGYSDPEDVLGEEIARAKIVGVIEDFYFESFHQAIRPLVINNMSRRISRLLIRIQPGDIRERIAELGRIWSSFDTGQPFDYSFLTDEMNVLYEMEQRTARVFGLFSGLSILIACLGLFCLAAYSIEQRTKEIGIRKAIGASARNIVLLLSKEVAWLVLAAVILAVPIVYVVAEKWLESFAYRIELGVPTFLMAGGIALVIAFISTGFQAIRAAVANPIESLRYE